MIMCLRCMLFDCVFATTVFRKRDLLRGRLGPELTAVIKFYIQQSRLQGHIILSLTLNGCYVQRKTGCDRR